VEQLKKEVVAMKRSGGAALFAFDKEGGDACKREEAIK
jgi:hypothetical protein